MINEEDNQEVLSRILFKPTENNDDDDEYEKYLDLLESQASVQSDDDL